MKSRIVLKVIENILRGTLILAIVLSIIGHSWMAVLISLLTLILTYLPFWIKNKYKINIPLDFEFAIILFVYAGLFLGEIKEFYDLFWWWDIMLHAGSAIALGCIGFIIIFILNKTNRLRAKPEWMAIFAFCFALSIGTIWEICEFSIDKTFGINMQKSGLTDTIWDLIIDCIGALIASLTGYAFMRGKEKSYLGKLIGLFIDKNPHL